jgi:hypothetical protein
MKQNAPQTVAVRIGAHPERLTKTLEIPVFARHDRMALAGAIVAALACPVLTSHVNAADTAGAQPTAAQTAESQIDPGNVPGNVQVAYGTPAEPATKGAIRPTAAAGKPTALRRPRAVSHKSSWSGYPRRSGGASLILGVRF